MLLSACADRSPQSDADPDQEAPVPLGYRYGDHPSQHVELTLPPGSGSVPVVVVVHGGFWRTGYGAELGRPLAADVVARGWAALNVEYRRVGPDPAAGGGGWPRTADDVAAALDSLAGPGQQHAAGRLDLARVVGLGHSAGGHLVGWLGGRGRAGGPSTGSGDASPTGSAIGAVRLSGVVIQAGVLDLVRAAREGLGGRAVPDLMGGGPEARPAEYALASPQALLPLGLPSVCVHGTADTVVPLTQSEAFVAAARAAGDEAELRAVEGDHFAPITVGSSAWAACTDALARLLAA